MPRGGRRKGAGRKTHWASGCTFPETITIRVPRVLKDTLLKIAYRLDAGEEIDLDTKSVFDLDTKSVIEENQRLKQELSDLRSRSAAARSQQKALPQEGKALLFKALLQKGRALLFDESLVRKRDRSPVKKVLAALLEIDKEYFN